MVSAAKDRWNQPELTYFEDLKAVNVQQTNAQFFFRLVDLEDGVDVIDNEVEHFVVEGLGKSVARVHGLQT